MVYWLRQNLQLGRKFNMVKEFFRNFLCRIGWHLWTPWDTPRVMPDGRSQQFRACKKCNKQQRHIF
jgi:hypothetical protein